MAHGLKRALVDLSCTCVRMQALVDKFRAAWYDVTDILAGRL